MKNEKAVAIAKDVLEQVGIRYNAYEGFYLLTSYDLTSKDGDLQEHLEYIEGQSCTVCALGAALLSKARLYDEIQVKKLFPRSSFYVNQDSVYSLLEDIFSIGQLELIESAFESRGMSSYNQCNQVDLAKAVAFGSNYLDSNQRLVAIMQNIVDNDGEFVP